MADRKAINDRELRALPVPALAAIAMALALDIDAGDDTARPWLETIFEILRGK